MTFLDDHWDDIVNNNIELPPALGGTPWDSWDSRPEGMAMIVTAIKLLQPTVVVETGTFRGYGTVEMAKAISSYAHDAVLWTVDAGAPVEGVDGDPLNLVPVDWKNLPEWEGWSKVISEREENVTKTFPGCEIRYRKGIAWDVLPSLLKDGGPWGFTFQDSCHYGSQVIKEWESFRDYSQLGSVVVFDDMTNNGGDFVAWFRENEPDWISKHIMREFFAPDHGQLWAERIA